MYETSTIREYLEDEISVGDTVICTKNVSFIDGTSHKIDDEIVVSEDTLSYFRIFTCSEGNYEKKDYKL